MKPTASPTARSGAAMAYDSARKRIVLFGGTVDFSNYPADTWEWDGQNWTQIKPGTSPTGRYVPGMVYDSVRQRILMFGGSNGGWFPHTAGQMRFLGDTWEWDGKNWTLLKPTTSPSARALPVMAYDSCRQRTVLTGGFIGHNYRQFFADTWEWDGQNWTQIKFTSPFPLLQIAKMVYDSARKRGVGFSSNPGGQISRTGEWDGKDWTVIKTATLPTPRSAYALAYDSIRQRTVLFGGASSIGKPLSDTWEYGGPRLALTADNCSVSTATGGTQQLLLNAGSQHGTRLYWIFGSVTGTTPGVTLGPVHIPLNPDPWTDYTIALPNTPILGNTKAALSGSGTAQASFNVPKTNLSSAIGLVFHHAYLVYDQSNNFYMASNPVTLRLVK